MQNWTVTPLFQSFQLFSFPSPSFGSALRCFDGNLRRGAVASGGTAASLPLPPHSPMASDGSGGDASGGDSDGGSRRQRRYHPPPSSPLVLVTWSAGSVAARDFAGRGLSVGSSLWFFFHSFFLCFLIANPVNLDELEWFIVDILISILV